MQIIEKYYDKNWKLKILKDKNKKIDFTVRFKKIKNGKLFPCCDFHGDCTNVAYAEVYPFMMKNSKKKGWNYLCKKHYLQEQKRFKCKLPASLKVEW
jgi:hypothetical protein